MRKIKRFVVTLLSVGLMLTGSMTAFAAEPPEQQSEKLAVSETIIEPRIVGSYDSSDAIPVRGNGVRLRRTPGTSGEIVGLLYEDADDWVKISGAIEMKDGYVWQQVVDSSIGLTGWIASNYIF